LAQGSRFCFRKAVHQIIEAEERALILKSSKMFACFAFVLSCCMALTESLSHTGQHINRDGQAGTFVKALEFKHRLRICNAYPTTAAIDIYKGKGERLNGDAPMPYKTCNDFVAPLKSGDKLEFKIGDANAGTFSVSDLPNNDAVLFLAIHRHDTLSTAVAFESHVFANLLNAQVAVIDTYKGTAKSEPRIMDAPGEGKDTRSEELRFESVVAVNPGVYDVALVGSDGKTKAKNTLVALNRESYIVLRTGVEAKQGPSYPQDLVVYPKMDPAALHSAAAPRTMMLSVLAVLGCAFWA